MGLKDHTIFEEETTIDEESFNITDSRETWEVFIRTNPDMDLDASLIFAEKFDRFMIGPVGKIGSKTIVANSVNVLNVTQQMYIDGYYYSAKVLKYRDDITFEPRTSIQLRIGFVE